MSSEPTSKDVDINCEECGPQKGTLKVFPDGSQTLSCWGCKRTHEMPAPPTPEEQGIPTGGADEMTWAALHPMLKQVVIASLEEKLAEAKARQAREMARTTALMASLGNAVSAMDSAIGGFASEFSGVMNRQLVAGTQMGDQAVCNAFSVALRELKK